MHRPGAEARENPAGAVCVAAGLRENEVTRRWGSVPSLGTDPAHGIRPTAQPRGDPVPDPSSFLFRHPVDVRFRDIDAMGHAHHGQALVYFEEARWAYWSEVVGPPSAEEIDFVLAEARIRWRARVLWPAQLSVAVRVAEVGRKHFTMEYEVTHADGTVLITGSTVQVMYDEDAGASVEISDEVRSRLTAFDGPFA